MLTVHKYSNKELFKLLSNPAFCSLSFQKQIMSEAHLFFKVFEILYRFWICRKNSENTFRFGIAAFEVVALNTRFYWERILVTRVNMLTNSLKIWDITKADIFELIFFESVKETMTIILLWKFNQCLGPFNMCWMSIIVLTLGFLGI